MTALLAAARHVASRAQSAGMAVAAPSPCNSVCRMDEASGLCTGCLRSIAEIIEWGQASDPRKRQVWAALALRAQAVLEPGAPVERSGAP